MRRDAYNVDVATQPRLAREFASKLFVRRKQTRIPYKTVITYKYSHNNTINEGQG